MGLCRCQSACWSSVHIARAGPGWTPSLSVWWCNTWRAVHLVGAGESKCAVDLGPLQIGRAALQALLDDLAATFAGGQIVGSQLGRGSSDLRTQICLHLHHSTDRSWLWWSTRTPPWRITGSRPPLTSRANVIAELMDVVVHPASRRMRTFDPH